ncbi:MAG: bifunctional phosphoribosylaminoimidazolecarboxamide formyltransferase/IMP cyclohydrolase [Bacteroidales bacterium]|nr:bifunctional phosphoribosylaminoimidazolecarboxamide formyltransferase/IMP cyclohydrolase [Bacteroidales bacterium]MEE3406234.1 bifunctional phosphoribosylaminoimidazolecarboxamide formyltransferase/IMP cyclohydrolase [Candidatus Cryptobacteroides sp.]SKC48824.1 phosphoribosylaminoimidazolecarboxamide formyltransferase / IMP cyclohydrolase [Bacteroidales bacterium WCE2008]MBO7365873.1 bifunctional phosphoribosylaminoimidazolecarboxamide formyltransferase/IMP cyclohydrolase [Bacteroidales bact
MRALISVSDKTGVVEFAKELVALGWEILSTSGTMKMLKEAGVPVTSVSDVTGFPEICDGRVKTLHPKIHGALLARRDIEDHMNQLKANGIEKIDLVCVNLYPFRETIAKPDVTMEDAVEHIDIGGPSMLRSAAKNWASVTVLVNPSDYATVISELKANGNTTPETRLQLSAKAYTHTAEYDMAISAYMRAQAGLSEKLFLEFEEKQALRYGENPHQEAKFYKSLNTVPYSLATAEQLNGKELSYNNIQDANAALCIVREFSEPFCVGLKHMNPCGSAVGKDVVDAWQKTYEGDKTSIFGGIVAFNREVNLAVAELLKPIFLEIIMAPSFAPDALELLSTKKNLRLLKVDMSSKGGVQKQYVSVNGGLLVQNQDIDTKKVVAEMCVTEAKPTAAQLADLDFGWHIVKHVKSNSIVIAKNGMTYGVGAGQMNRIGSAEIALKQASATLGGNLEGCVMASDGFFPFDDCVDIAAQYGIKAIVQPGGSVRDEDSIKKANENGITMLMTGERHFKH